jgi:hypothetical protein
VSLPSSASQLDRYSVVITKELAMNTRYIVSSVVFLIAFSLVSACANDDDPTKVVKPAAGGGTSVGGSTANGGNPTTGGSSAKSGSNSNGGATDTVDSLTTACEDSGGTVKTAQCCKTSNDFPNNCNIGACGCSPSNSEDTLTCECPTGKCFDGHSCVAK